MAAWFVRAVCGLTWVCATAVAVAQTPAKVRFTLDWRFEGQTSYVWLAQQRGYFTREGLDVQIDAGAGSATAIQRIASGVYDIGIGDVSVLIEFLGNNPTAPGIQIVYQLYDEAPLGYFALKKSGIRTWSDLKGKTVTGAPFEITRRLWPIVARAAGLEADAIKFVNVDPVLRANSVINGSVDVAGGFYNAPLEFEQRGVKRDELVTLKAADLGIKLYGNAVMASAKMIAEQPQAVAGFVRAFNQALREGLADPPVSIKALKAREPIADEKVELERFTWMIPAIVNARTRADGLGGVNRADLAKQVDDVTAIFSLKSKPNADQLFTDRFLPARDQRMPPK